MNLQQSTFAQIATAKHIGVFSAGESLVVVGTLHRRQEQGCVASVAGSFVVFHKLEERRFIVQLDSHIGEILAICGLLVDHLKEVLIGSFCDGGMKSAGLIGHTANEFIVAEDQLPFAVGVMSDAGASMGKLQKVNLPEFKNN